MQLHSMACRGTHGFVAALQRLAAADEGYVLLLLLLLLLRIKSRDTHIALGQKASGKP